MNSKVSAAALLIRLMVGSVFLCEGILKFLYPAALGAGRLAKIGIPSPHFMGPFVGGVESLCGTLVLVGLLTRWAAVPLLVTISVAILTTKIPILLGHGFGPFTLAELPRYGFLSMMHEARADLSMFCGLLSLLFLGGGKWAVEARILRRSAKASSSSKS